MEPSLTYEEACLIIVHGCMLKFTQETGSDTMFTHAIIQKMISLGIPMASIEGILRAALEKTTQFDSACEVVELHDTPDDGRKPS